MFSSSFSDRRSVFTIDGSNLIVEVNRPFLEALPVAMQAVDQDAFVGRSIWEFIPGTLPRQLWEVLYSRVRAVGAPVFVPLRMDTPDMRRLIDLELHPLGDRFVRHVGECIWTEARPAIALLDPNYPRDSRKLSRCAWCARIRVDFGSWVEIEQAQAMLELEAIATLPTVHDSACTSCTQSMLKTFPVRAA